ncbi:MAG TPA: hypothetical protein VHX86_17110 [Tepidisphaeraceae bacterium]|jgi:hypothetical protein|nr:hypothetical protein [Tepidisphaeraceae bacterium]
MPSLAYAGQSNFVAALVGTIFLTAGGLQAQLTYTTISDPLGTSTWARAVSGGEILGNYLDNQGNGHGFIYNGTSYTTLDDPYAFGYFGTQPSGISGHMIVGSYQDVRDGWVRGFTYEDGSFTPLDDPLATGTTEIEGISGNTIVGIYQDSADQFEGFSYNGSTFTTLDDPAAMNGTFAMGISGNTIVGYYRGASNGAGSSTHGFIYNGSTYTNFDFPSSSSGGTAVDPLLTEPAGVSGNLVVGYTLLDFITFPGTGVNTVSGEDGFVYDGTNFSTLSDPAAATEYGYGTSAQGIDGNTVVGFYYLNYDTTEGFEVTVPEPGSGLIVAMAGAWLMRRARQRPLFQN